MTDSGQKTQKVMIIGASHAGVACAEQLRLNGFSGHVTLIDRLAGKPLERPPLSKAFLQADDDDETRFLLRRDDWFDTQDVRLIDGREVTGIDVVNHSVELDDGGVHPYDRLILATGALPRWLAGTEQMRRAFVLRDPDDARAIRATIPQAKTAIIVGGGYIGLEAAASLVKAGLDVHVVEMADRLLARVASPEISAFFTALHQDHGVHVHLDALSDEILQDESGFIGVRLGDGRRLDGDMLLVGIGVAPDTALAEAAGIVTDNGIVVDATMQTSVADVYAIGDVARWSDAAMRIESVDNAQCGALAAAAAICGRTPPSTAAPWFWSEQFDVRLQSAGIVPAASSTVRRMVRPGKRAGGMSVWSYDSGTLVAVEAVRDPAAYALGKTCLDRAITPPLNDVGDPGFDLKAFIAQAEAQA